MRVEPQTKRVVAFFDGQNLYYHAKAAFGYTYPNYDVIKMAKAVCESRNAWQLAEARFYTGVPTASDNPFWHSFWTSKLAAMGRDGVIIYSRPLRYRNKTFRLPDGAQHSVLVGEEKGIDIRIALDAIALANARQYDVAVLFSQDQDLSEVAREIRTISRQQDRWINVACAFPMSPTVSNRRGINDTDWIRIDRGCYDRCTDPNDYRKAPY